MDFTFDMSQTPLIGRKAVGGAAVADVESINSNSMLLQRRSTSLSPSDSAVPGWKRPWLCQVITGPDDNDFCSEHVNFSSSLFQSRVRELLVNLLMTCGQRVGLPKSPSVCMLMVFTYRSKDLPR